MVTGVYFIRHAQSEANARGIFQGLNADTPLTKKGICQAKELKRKMQALPVDGVYCSPARRAVETAKIVFGNTFILDGRLVERDLGEWSGRKKDAVARDEPEKHALYKKCRVIEGVKGAESLEGLACRVRSFFDDILPAYFGKRIAIVGHGLFGKMLIALLQGISFSGGFLSKTPMRQGTLCVVEFSGKKIGAGTLVEVI